MKGVVGDEVDLAEVNGGGNEMCRVAIKSAGRVLFKDTVKNDSRRSLRLRDAMKWYRAVVLW